MVKLYKNQFDSQNSISWKYPLKVAYDYVAVVIGVQLLTIQYCCFCFEPLLWNSLSVESACYSKHGTGSISPEKIFVFLSLSEHKDGVNRMAIDSVRKALEIVDLLSSKRGGYSLTEIASELLIAVSTVYKQLQSLVELGLVHKDPHTGRYFITYKIVELSSRILKNLEFRDIARPFLIELLEELRMTVHLVVRENLHAVYVEKIEGPYTIPTISRMGMQIDLYSTSVGKAILAYSPEEFIEEYLSKVDLQKKTPRTIINPVELRTELTRVKGRGYALDNEENEFGICCIGSPIFDHNNNVFAALSVTAASQQFLPESITKTANCVLQKARNISIALGCSI